MGHSSVLCAVLNALLFEATASSPLPAVDLRAELAQLPVTGLQSRHPRFSWSLRQLEKKRGTVQSAYRVTVSLANTTAAVAAASGAATWDSGLVRSNATAGVTCGVALASDTEYTLSVLWWDQSDLPAPATEARFATALLDPADWAGSEWLTLPGATDPRNQFRATLTLPDTAVSRGSCFIAGLGYHRSHMNGARLGHPDATRRDHNRSTPRITPPPQR